MGILNWWSNKGKAATKEAAGDAVIAGLVFEVIKTITNHIGSCAAERVKTKYMEMDALRAMLARAMIGLSPEDKEHLKRRLQEARKTPGKEDRIVADICQILKDDSVEKGSASAEAWLTGLKKLNALSDDEFELILCVAENDRGVQYFQRIFREGLELTGVVGNNGILLAKLGLEKLDATGNALTPSLRRFNDWLEGK